MKLTLHIGTPKTGTTSLQRWFAGQRAALLAQGVWYPEALGAENHRKLMTFARDTDKPDDSFPRFGIRSPEDHARFRDTLAAAFDAEAAEARAAGAQVALISNEHLWSKINTKDQVERLRAFLDARFDTVTVVLHLRPQVDLMISNASQLARMGTLVTEAELTREGIGPKNAFYGYDRTVAVWEGVFGPERLALVPFRRQPDITAVLTAALGIDTAGLPAPVRENRGLDWRAIALANAVTRGFAETGVAVPPWPIDDLPGAERLAPGRALLQGVQARFEAGNAALAARRADITAADLTPDWDAHPVEGNLALLDAPCFFAPQIAHLVRRMAQDRALETWRRHIAEGRAAALAGDKAAVAAARRAATRAADALARLNLPLPEDVAAALPPPAPEPAPEPAPKPAKPAAAKAGGKAKGAAAAKPGKAAAGGA